MSGVPAQEFAGLPASISCPGEEHGGEQMNREVRESRQRGFSLLEMIVVLAMSLTLGAIAMLGYQSVANYLRTAGDLRDLYSLVGQAKMNAAANFTQTRVYADLTKNTFHLEIWNKTANGGVGCWVTVGDPLASTANPCTAATSPVQNLVLGDVFGFDQVTTPPPNTQTVIALPPVCAGNNGTGTIANTACLVFNSRGVPIKNNVPDGTGAFYLNNGKSVYGLTVALSGFAQNWSVPDHGSGVAWMHQ
jgi:prepilin-type N-terminal cleavage/methylation domain-containing protein